MSRERAKTYGEELRTWDAEKLTRGELVQLRQEREWEASNPQEVAALDALVGQRVVLVKKDRDRSYATWAEELSPEHRRIPWLPAGSLIPTHLRPGLSFVVVMRLGERLLGIDAVGEPWLLRREWLRVVQHRVDQKHDGVQLQDHGSAERGAQRAGSSGDEVARRPRRML